MKFGSVVAVGLVCLAAGAAIGYRAALKNNLGEEVEDEFLDVYDEEESIEELEKLDGVE